MSGDPYQEKRQKRVSLGEGLGAFRISVTDLSFTDIFSEVPNAESI
jgi:hypothetical protein